MYRLPLLALIPPSLGHGPPRAAGLLPHNKPGLLPPPGPEASGALGERPERSSVLGCLRAGPSPPSRRLGIFRLQERTHRCAAGLRGPVPGRQARLGGACARHGLRRAVWAHTRGYRAGAPRGSPGRQVQDQVPKLSPEDGRGGRGVQGRVCRGEGTECALQPQTGEDGL